MKIQTKWGVDMEQHHYVWCPKCGFKEVEASILFIASETLTCPKCQTTFNGSKQRNHTIRYDFPADISDEVRAVIHEEFRQWADEHGLPMTINDLREQS